MSLQARIRSPVLYAPPRYEGVLAALENLRGVAEELARRRPDVPVHYDLAELRAYQYQTGVVFAAFVPGEGTEVARGGRYDDIGKSFGRARPATGFSADIRCLLKLMREIGRASCRERV